VGQEEEEVKAQQLIEPKILNFKRKKSKSEDWRRE
jgi:hypothetical protein